MTLMPPCAPCCPAAPWASSPPGGLRRGTGQPATWMCLATWTAHAHMCLEVSGPALGRARGNSATAPMASRTRWRSSIPPSIGGPSTQRCCTGLFLFQQTCKTFYRPMWHQCSAVFQWAYLHNVGCPLGFEGVVQIDLKGSLWLHQVGSVGIPEEETMRAFFPDPAHAAPPQHFQTPSGLIEVCIRAYAPEPRRWSAAVPRCACHPLF